MSSLIVPGGRRDPHVTQNVGPVPVDYAFIVAAETSGDVIVLDAGQDIDVQREAQPDDIYGAITLVITDGVDYQLSPVPKTFEYAFLVLKMSGGKVLLGPDVKLEVNPVRHPNGGHVIAALGTLGANILAMKTTDMLMSSLQAQAAAMQNAQIARAAGLG